LVDPKCNHMHRRQTEAVLRQVLRRWCEDGAKRDVVSEPILTATNS
jgi:hypothetical protein